MTRTIVIGGGVAILVIIIAVVAVLFTSLDRIIKTAVETIGPEITKANVKLAEVNISATSGTGSLKGLLIGNPAGFKTERAFFLGEVSVEVDVGSITSDTIVINKVLIKAPEVTYELSGSGSNLDAIQKNIEAYTGGGKGAEAGAKAESKKEEGGKKLIIKELIISDGKIGVSASLLGGKQLNVPLPTIRLTDIGKKEKGATPGEVAEKVIGSITKSAGSAATAGLGSIKDAAASGAKAVGDVMKGAGEKAGGMVDGIKGMFGSGSK